MEITPQSEYGARLDARRGEVEAALAREELLGRLRLAVFIAAVVAVWLLRATVPLSVLLGLPVAMFVGLVLQHERVRRRLARARRAVSWYERGLDRLEGRFAGVGLSGEEWLDDTHPYAGHLDIFGEGSLYQLLCGARTSSGRAALAGWLSSPASPAEIADRQLAVDELRPRLDLREDLAVMDEEVVDALAAEELVAWSVGPSPLPLDGPIRFIALGFAGAALVAAGAIPWLGVPPFAWILLAAFVFWLPLRQRVEAVIEALERPSLDLRHVQRALARVEAEKFETPWSERIDEALGGHDPPASEVVSGLLKRVDALQARENMMFAPVSLALLWGTNCAFSIERWRARHGSEVGGWIEAIGDLEAMLDLSRFAYEHPEYVFPVLSEATPRLRAEGLAHPLLAECTPNDLDLGEVEQIVVVTGSNMSGKSTLLRTVGTNAVLAQAGAPVRAKRLELSPLSIGASIRTLDSLLDGASRFYAEIHAIKRAVDQAESAPPGLFLLDELLHGTNSEDRRIGAGAIVRALLDRGAVGVITTHDLALAAIADELGSDARNAHFEFALDGGEIRFDYTLHPGTVKAGNALAIMRAAGLEV
ncbi:MAG: DNA mismatch repair protein MutS [Gemmatimonadota bacterium]|nr:DNA mismatch repair protein MutS [Gemmatimonadota bacterium]